MKQKIFCIIGRGGAGKDTILKMLLKINKNLINIPEITTRDIRENEVNGKDKIFLSNEDFLKKINNGEIVAHYIQPVIDRQGNDIDVYYGYTIPDNNTIIISTGLEIYKKLTDRKEFDIIPIYIEGFSQEILYRLIIREHNDSNPNFKEAIRRFFEDQDRYSLSAISNLNIPEENIFWNYGPIDDVVNKINLFINKFLDKEDECMSDCLKNMTIEEIKENFGKDDMKTCNSCPNLKYEDGMLQCTLIKK